MTPRHESGDELLKQVGLRPDSLARATRSRASGRRVRRLPRRWRRRGSCRRRRKLRTPWRSRSAPGLALRMERASASRSYGPRVGRPEPASAGRRRHVRGEGASVGLRGVRARAGRDARPSDAPHRMRRAIDRGQLSPLSAESRPPDGDIRRRGARALASPTRDDPPTSSSAREDGSHQPLTMFVLDERYGNAGRGR